MNSAMLEASFVRTARRAPYLQREQEHELAVRWKEEHDSRALNLIVTAHMRLVIAMAARFKSFGLPMNDLVQEGHVGLMQAAARFEPERQLRFSTYATWWIRASIQDYVLRNWSIVRGGTSSAQKSLFFNLRRLRAKLAVNPDSSSVDRMHGEIAGALGVSKSDVALMDSRLSGPDASLNAPVSGEDEGGADKVEFLVCDAPLPDQIAGDTIDKERRSNWLERALGVLDQRELMIISDRRLREDGATLETLGQTLGISKERVRQIEVRALEKLKNALIRDDFHAGS